MPAESSEFRDWLRDEGVRIIETEAFDPRNPYCNKLQQLDTFIDSAYDEVLFMDCDTAWVGSRQIPTGAPVAAKPVDAANPPESVLMAIFLQSGLGEPDWVPVSLPAGEDRARSDWNNCNGGLYVVQANFISDLAPRWKYWARWCLDNEQLFGSKNTHADQVSFALAMRELGARVRHLDLSWNYPTHISVNRGLPDITPNIIHYHRQLTPHMTLQSVGLSKVDRAIEKLNEHIRDFNQERLINSMFWDFRYLVAPDLGSGIGSRGDNLTYKRNLLANQLSGISDVEVVDVGCGDLEVTRDLEIMRYMGLDVSDVALTIAMEKRPDWTFRRIRSYDDIPSADIVICLDVLIHQPDDEEFFGLVNSLAKVTRHTLLVSGYEAPPQFTSELTRYYVPLREALLATGEFTSIEIVGSYRDITVFRAKKLKQQGVKTLVGAIR